MTFSGPVQTRQRDSHDGEHGNQGCIQWLVFGTEKEIKAKKNPKLIENLSKILAK
jgi:hypothetical protein